MILFIFSIMNYFIGLYISCDGIQKSMYDLKVDMLLERLFYSGLWFRKVVCLEFFVCFEVIG